MEIKRFKRNKKKKPHPIYDFVPSELKYKVFPFKREEEK